MGGRLDLGRLAHVLMGRPHDPQPWKQSAHLHVKQISAPVVLPGASPSPGLTTPCDNAHGGGYVFSERYPLQGLHHVARTDHGLSSLPEREAPRLSDSVLTFNVQSTAKAISGRKVSHKKTSKSPLDK